MSRLHGKCTGKLSFFCKFYDTIQAADLAQDHTSRVWAAQFAKQDPVSKEAGNNLPVEQLDAQDKNRRKGQTWQNSMMMCIMLRSW